MIEAGFPVVSRAEMENVTNIARMGLNARICCLARAKIGDVEAAIACDVDMVSIFVATSDLHIRHKYKKPKEQVVSEALEAVDFAHDHGVEVRFAAEDASRTDRAFLKEFYRQGEDHGADFLRLRGHCRLPDPPRDVRGDERPCGKCATARSVLTAITIWDVQPRTQSRPLRQALSSCIPL